MHSGPLRNPGTVPFVWEQTPGKPKDDPKTHKPLINPPPGRVLESKEQGLCDVKGPTKDGFGKSEDCKNERTQITYGPNFLELNDNDDEEDDGEFEYDGNGNMSLKFCGLLLQFCLKGSIGMLNQTPGLSVRTRLPVSSANRTHVGASYAGSQDAEVAGYQPNHQSRIQKTQPSQITNMVTVYQLIVTIRLLHLLFLRT
ncbi:uncharacterized protein LOC143567417 [Bidens hawaiensis]|uniref:uncharacterized protein LOC143567417 n=1 Tax=Bidens hawaiensis TaxID=980011 RepID=UPI00404BA0AB